jgi:hypothetical protein
MSIVDRTLGAITPPESDETRAEATRKAREAAGDGDWLALALEHHDLIREAFEVCCQADGAEDRLMAMKRLALVLNGHSLAEEIVLYPAMAKVGERGSASLAFTEQTTAKMQMAELERIAPMAPEWRDKLQDIREAVLHHIFEEEDRWFIRLRDEYPDQAFLTRRYQEEFKRYTSGVRVVGGNLLREESRSWDTAETRPDPGMQSLG